MIIYLGLRLPLGSMRPTRVSIGAGNTSTPIWPCSERGLPCDLDYSRPGALLPHLFTFACFPIFDRDHRRCIFCGTFHPGGVAPPVPRYSRGALPCGVRTFLPRRHHNDEVGGDHLPVPCIVKELSPALARLTYLLGWREINKTPAVLATMYPLVPLQIVEHLSGQFHVTSLAGIVHNRHHSPIGLTSEDYLIHLA